MRRSSACWATISISRLLEEALTHKSYSNERRTKERTQKRASPVSRDAVPISGHERISRRNSRSNEGLSKLKAHLVSEASLAKAARRMKLGRLLRLGKAKSCRRDEKNIPCWPMRSKH